MNDQRRYLQLVRLSWAELGHGSSIGRFHVRQAERGTILLAARMAQGAARLTAVG